MMFIEAIAQKLSITHKLIGFIANFRNHVERIPKLILRLALGLIRSIIDRMSLKIQAAL